MPSTRGSFNAILYGPRSGRAERIERGITLREAIRIAEEWTRGDRCFASVRRRTDGKLIGEAMPGRGFMISA